MQISVALFNNWYFKLFGIILLVFITYKIINFLVIFERFSLPLGEI